jgi:hypothetical protein
MSATTRATRRHPRRSEVSQTLAAWLQPDDPRFCIPAFAGKKVKVA